MINGGKVKLWEQEATDRSVPHLDEGRDSRRSTRGCFNGGDVLFFLFFFLQKSLYTSTKRCVVKDVER